MVEGIRQRGCRRRPGARPVTRSVATTPGSRRGPWSSRSRRGCRYRVGRGSVLSLYVPACGRDRPDPPRPAEAKMPAGLEAAARWRAVQAKLGRESGLRRAASACGRAMGAAARVRRRTRSRPGGDPADPHGRRAGEPRLEHVRRALAPGGHPLPPRAALGKAPGLGTARAARDRRRRLDLPLGSLDRCCGMPWTMQTGSRA